MNQPTIVKISGYLEISEDKIKPIAGIIRMVISA
jgi:hypothetical protein